MRPYAPHLLVSRSSQDERQATVPYQINSFRWPRLDFTLVQDHVRTVLEGTIVVGFDITNDLKVLGISLTPEKVWDIQKYFDAERCSQLDLREKKKGLLALDRQHTKTQPKKSGIVYIA